MKSSINGIFFTLTAVMFSITSTVRAGEPESEELLHSNMIIKVEITINRPASQVWPYLMDFGSYLKTDFIVKTVAGEPNKEGEVQRLYSTKIPLKEQEDKPGYFFKTIKIVPEKFWYGINPATSSRNALHTGFNVLALIENNGKTKVTYIGGKEATVSSKQSYENAENGHQALVIDGTLRWEKDYLPRLKKLVEES